MSILSPKINTWLTIGITLLFAIFLPIVSQNISILILLLLIIYWGVLALAWPRLGLFLLLFLRPCLDAYNELGLLNWGEKELNLAGLLSLSLLLVAAILAYRQRQTPRPPLSLAWFFFLALNFASLGWSQNLALSLAEALRLLSFFAVFFYAYSIIDNRRQLERLFGAIALSGLLPSLVALWQFFTRSGLTIPFEGIYNRIYGTFVHPNLLAYYLLLPLTALAYFLLKDRRHSIEKYFFGLIGLFYLFILILTFTRGAWLVFFIMLGLIGLFYYRIILVAGMVFSMLAYALVPGISTRVNDLLFNPYSSVDWRRDLWRDASKYAQERPLLGFGAGTAKDLIAQRRGPQFGSADPHNDYLKVSLETGFWGLLAYLWLTSSLMLHLIGAHRYGSHENRTAAFILLSLFIGLSLLSFGDNLLRNTALQLALWAMVGATLKLKNKKPA